MSFISKGVFLARPPVDRPNKITPAGHLKRMDSLEDLRGFSLNCFDRHQYLINQVSPKNGRASAGDGTDTDQILNKFQKAEVAEMKRDAAKAKAELEKSKEEKKKYSKKDEELDRMQGQLQKVEEEASIVKRASLEIAEENMEIRQEVEIMRRTIEQKEKEWAQETQHREQQIKKYEEQMSELPAIEKEIDIMKKELAEKEAKLQEEMEDKDLQIKAYENQFKDWAAMEEEIETLKKLIDEMQERCPKCAENQILLDVLKEQISEQPALEKELAMLKESKDCTNCINLQNEVSKLKDILENSADCPKCALYKNEMEAMKERDLKTLEDLPDCLKCGQYKSELDNFQAKDHKKSNEGCPNCRKLERELSKLKGAYLDLGGVLPSSAKDTLESNFDDKVSQGWKESQDGISQTEKLDPTKSDYDKSKEISDRDDAFSNQISTKDKLDGINDSGSSKYTSKEKGRFSDKMDSIQSQTKSEELKVLEEGGKDKLELEESDRRGAEAPSLGSGVTDNTASVKNQQSLRPSQRTISELTEQTNGSQILRPSIVEQAAKQDSHRSVSKSGQMESGADDEERSRGEEGRRPSQGKQGSTPKQGSHQSVAKSSLIESRADDKESSKDREGRRSSHGRQGSTVKEDSHHSKSGEIESVRADKESVKYDQGLRPSQGEQGSIIKKDSHRSVSKSVHNEPGTGEKKSYSYGEGRRSNQTKVSQLTEQPEGSQTLRPSEMEHGSGGVKGSTPNQAELGSDDKGSSTPNERGTPRQSKVYELKDGQRSSAGEKHGALSEVPDQRTSRMQSTEKADDGLIAKESESQSKRQYEGRTSSREHRFSEGERGTKSIEGSPAHEGSISSTSVAFLNETDRLKGTPDGGVSKGKQTGAEDESGSIDPPEKLRTGSKNDRDSPDRKKSWLDQASKMGDDNDDKKYLKEMMNVDLKSSKDPSQVTSRTYGDDDSTYKAGLKIYEDCPNCLEYKKELADLKQRENQLCPKCQSTGADSKLSPGRDCTKECPRCIQLMRMLDETNNPTSVCRNCAKCRKYENELAALKAERAVCQKCQDAENKPEASCDKCQYYEVQLKALKEQEISKNGEYQNEIERLNEELKRSSGEQLSAVEGSKEKEAENAKLAGKVAGLEREMDDLREFQIEYKKLKDENELLKEQIEKSKAASTEQSSVKRLTGPSPETVDLLTRIQKLEEEIAEKDKEISNMEEIAKTQLSPKSEIKLTEKQSNNEPLSAVANENSANEIKNSKKNSVQSGEQTANLKESREVNLPPKSDIDKQVKEMLKDKPSSGRSTGTTAAAAEIQKLKKELIDKENEIRALKEAPQTKELPKSDLENELEQLRKEKTEIELLKNEECETLRAKLAELSGVINDMNQRLSENLGSTSRLSQELTDSKARVDEIEDKNEKELSDREKAYTEEKKKLKERFSKEKDKLSIKSKQSISQLQNDHKREVDALRKEMGMMQKANEEAIQEVTKRYAEELDKLKRTDAIEEDDKVKKEKLNGLKDQLNKTLKALEDERAKSAKLERKLKQATRNGGEKQSTNSEAKAIALHEQLNNSQVKEIELQALKLRDSLRNELNSCDLTKQRFQCRNSCGDYRR